MLNPVMPSPDLRADADLVLASQKGDQDAFTSIVARYQNLVCSMAYSALGDLGHSEDVAQEAWRLGGTYRASGNSPASAPGFVASPGT